MTRGKFIVLYGINNLGKTTQLGLLFDRIGATGRVRRIKYPIYNLEPSGPVLNDYLRGGNPNGLSPREFQIIQALNRTQYEQELVRSLDGSGFNVVSEDYLGTSIAWGMGAGVDRVFLEEINSHLRKPDVAVLLDGERFTSGIERVHAHESDNGLTEIVRQIHLELAHDYGWYVVNANQTQEQVHSDIWQIVSPLLA